MQADGSLRAITNRLTVTPVEDLPRICGFLANQLANCALESHFSDLKGSSSSVAGHKLKTRISSLLQDRSASGRLTAAVLIKAVVENGGPNVLSASESWARGLLGCLNKPDAYEVKKLYLITITRIFILTQNQPHLLREITTPLLPHFLKTCLGLIKPVETQVAERSARAPSPLLTTVLKCFIQLLPRHATVFRTELGRIRTICYGVLGTDESSSASRDLAGRLLCLLLACAPKNSAAQEWSQTAQSIVNSAHETADNLFRAVLEEYESNSSDRQKSTGKQDFSKEPHLAGRDSIRLGTWKGIHQGSLRLSTLLTWLGNLLSTPTSQAVAVPVGATIDLVARITAVTVPESPEPLRFHKEASRDEKEELRLNLPSLHACSLRLLHVVCTTYGPCLVPLHRIVASQAASLLQALPYHEEVRCSIYDLFSSLLEEANLNDLALSRDALVTIITECCHDLKRGVSGLDVHSNSNDVTNAALNINSNPKGNIAPGQGARDSQSPSKQSDVYASAWKLLPKLLKCGSASLIPRHLRVEMDRLSVLLDHQEAMLSSVMRPVLSKSGKATTPSLLPFLARSAGKDLAVEALLRPRRPVIQVGAAPELEDSATSQAAIDQTSEGSGGNHVDDIQSRVDDAPNEEDLDAQRPGEGIGDGGSIPDIATKKRTFVDIAEGPQEVALVQEAADQRDVKRLRPEEDLAHIPILAADDVSHNHLTMNDLMEMKSAGTEVGANSQPHTISSVPNTVPEPSTAMLPAKDEEGEDSDDSEIPTIDAGLDTDEEEDE